MLENDLVSGVFSGFSLYHASLAARFGLGPVLASKEVSLTASS